MPCSCAKVQHGGIIGRNTAVPPTKIQSSRRRIFVDRSYHIGPLLVGCSTNMKLSEAARLWAIVSIGDRSPLHSYEKVIKVKADVAALHIFSGDIDDDASGGVESCQGRRLLAFILTLDRSPRHFIIERRTKRNAVQLSYVPWLMGLGFCFCWTSNR